MITTENNEKNPLQSIAGVAIMLAAVMICIMGFMQVSKANDVYTKSLELIDKIADKDKLASIVNLNAMKEGYNQALTYFAVAVGALAVAGTLPRLLSFTIGPQGVTASLKQLEKDVAQLKHIGMAQERLMQEQLKK